MEPKDSGLQTAMRTLLNIIAGLLIADMLKNVVNTFRNSPSELRMFNMLLVAGAALFLFRVVVDNILFYELDDRTAAAYVRRVALLGIDLTSYAICYLIVAELEPGKMSEKWKIFSPQTLLYVIGGIAAVELLHAIWCGTWLWALRVIKMDAKEKSIREERLRTWGLLSLRFCALGGCIAGWFRWWPPGYEVGTYLIVAYSVVSFVWYLTAMKKHYTGTADSWT